MLAAHLARGVVGIAKESGTPHSLRILVAHSGPNRSLPGFSKQPGRALYTRHLEQRCLFFNLLSSMFVLISFWLSVCVLIAQLSQNPNTLIK